MPRFFIETCLPQDQSRLTLAGDDAHHIKDVLCMKIGEVLTVCDGAGVDLAVVIETIGKQGVGGRILSRSINQTEPPYHITLFQGLPKGDKMEQIIQKAVELGVYRIVPVQCRRSVARIDQKDIVKKMTRWNRVTLEAAKQCGRGQVPLVEAPLSFAAAARTAGQADLSWIPWENERERSLKSLFDNITMIPKSAPESRPSSISVSEPVSKSTLNQGVPEQKSGQNPAGSTPTFSFLIGPEGGFAPEEIEQALAQGITPVTLGRRILRTETAGLAVLAIVGYQFDRF